VARRHLDQQLVRACAEVDREVQRVGVRLRAAIDAGDRLAVDAQLEVVRRFDAQDVLAGGRDLERALQVRGAADRERAASEVQRAAARADLARRPHAATCAQVVLCSERGARLDAAKLLIEAEQVARAERPCRAPFGDAAELRRDRLRCRSIAAAVL
jgi:hypothetical protein